MSQSLKDLNSLCVLRKPQVLSLDSRISFRFMFCSPNDAALPISLYLLSLFLLLAVPMFVALVPFICIQAELGAADFPRPDDRAGLFRQPSLSLCPSAGPTFVSGAQLRGLRSR